MIRIDASELYQDTMTNIPPEIQPYKRAAWKPITIESDGSLTASKFAGKP
ncbi:hypothetical protein [Okeania sp.]|nr:hypothetical protein [Okeania sp.]MEB3341385.1 hypothetical protein [Okeania sp.]